MGVLLAKSLDRDVTGNYCEEQMQCQLSFWRPNMTRTLAVISLAFASAVASAGATDYPVRQIRLVVGLGAGGPTDIPARFVAEKLGDRLGQRVIVGNKPAAAGMIATRDVLSQPRDGYNLLLCTNFGTRERNQIGDAGCEQQRGQRQGKRRKLRQHCDRRPAAVRSGDGRRQHTYDYREGGCRQARNAEVSAKLGFGRCPARDRRW
jgi:hypothetical protein